jgi:molecular chaperone GrpE
MEEDLKKKLEEAEKAKENYLNGWKRERADFLNYKKDEMERVEGLVCWAREEFLLKVLPIIDAFYLVESKVPEELKKEENMKGVLSIKNIILDFLKGQNVSEIKSVGEKFDPNIHEAIEEISSGEEKSNLVVEEIQKGYEVKGKLLRPAKVRVGK